MTTESPMTPADCDLRGMPYMPLYGDRLFGSATWIGARAEAKVAALRLWWRSFAHEVPAASLPDDDTLLADYAGYGVGVKAWRKVKPQAMRGWILCTDGRLYHRTVAEVALEAWAQRKRNREKQEKWRQKNRLVTIGLTPLVTVTPGVIEPLCNAGSEVKGEGSEESSSEAKASGADAPDPVKLVFDAGVKILTATGLKESQARSLIGKWRKDNGDDAVLAAIGSCQRSNVSEPVSWIAATFKAERGEDKYAQRDREIQEAIQRSKLQ